MSTFMPSKLSELAKSIVVDFHAVPTRRQWMKALREPQQNTLGKAVHDGGQGLHSQVWHCQVDDLFDDPLRNTLCGMIFTTFTICR